MLRLRAVLLLPAPAIPHVRGIEARCDWPSTPSYWACGILRLSGRCAGALAGLPPSPLEQIAEAGALLRLIECWHPPVLSTFPLTAISSRWDTRRAAEQAGPGLQRALVGLCPACTRSCKPQQATTISLLPKTQHGRSVCGGCAHAASQRRYRQLRSAVTVIGSRYRLHVSQRVP